MKIAKKILLLLTLTALTGAYSSASSFSGRAGIKGDLTSNKDSEFFDPVLNLKSYFSGQINFSSNFFIRSELNVKTADVVETKMIEDTEAVFRINELSATYIAPFLGITQYFSLFTGSYEPLGSDTFLERQFGIDSISSLITENWSGVDCVSPYSFYGTGGSYIIHLNNMPYTGGIYIYKNEENEEKIKQLNIDLRIASVMKYLTFDAAAGLGAPMGSKNGTEDVILLIDEIYLHTGINLLLGHNYTQSLFLQAGFENMPIKAGEKTNEISSDKIYLLVEPRLYTQNFRAHLTAFSLPAKAVEKMDFIDTKTNTLGVNLAIFTDQLYIGNRDFTFGFHTTLSFPDRDFYDIKRIKELKDDDYTVKVSPFVDAPFMNGEFKIMLQAKINSFETKNWQNQFKLTAGYKLVL